MAGVPKPVLERAKEILRNLEDSELTPEGNVRQSSRRQQDRDKLKKLRPGAADGFIWLTAATGSRFQPLHEPFDLRLLGLGRDFVAGMFLNADRKMIIRLGCMIRLPGRFRAYVDAWQRRVIVGITINHQHWTRCRDREHGRPIELSIDARHDAIIELFHERCVGVGYAGLLRDGIKCGLDCPNAPMPVVIVERPTKALTPMHGTAAAMRVSTAAVK